jgi:PEP-CTERM motif
MWRMSLRRCLLVVVLGIVPSSVSATPITLDFESLTEFTSVTTEFAGVTFSNATVLAAGSTLNEFELPPHSGQNVVFDDGGAMSIMFAGTVSSFGGYFTYFMPLTITAFDASHNAIATASSTFGTNLGLSGDPGSAPNELLTLSSAIGISSILISGDPGGGSFVMDDATYDTAGTVAPVPEPGTISLLTLGLVSMAGRRLTRLRREASQRQRARTT